MTVRLERVVGATDPDSPNFTKDEQALLTAVVSRAEHHGRTVVPLVVTSNDVFFAIARTAQDLAAEEVVLGRSAKFSGDFLAESMALRWGSVEPDGARALTIRVASAHDELRFAL